MLEVRCPRKDHIDRNRPNKERKCDYCGRNHAKGQCSAYGKQCKKCGKANHFAVMCRSNRALNVTHHLERTEKDEELSVFSIGQSVVKKVKLDGIEIPMQLDSGSQATLIPRNLWEDMGKPRLSKTSVSLKQFDGTLLRTIGQYSAAIEMDKKFVMGTIVVTACTKSHGLLGTDVLKVNFHDMSVHVVDKTDEHNYPEFSFLKYFQANIVLQKKCPAIIL